MCKEKFPAVVTNVTSHVGGEGSVQQEGVRIVHGADEAAADAPSAARRRRDDMETSRDKDDATHGGRSQDGAAPRGAPAKTFFLFSMFLAFQNEP